MVTVPAQSLEGVLAGLGCELGAGCGGGIGKEERGRDRRGVRDFWAPTRAKFIAAARFIPGGMRC